MRLKKNIFKIYRPLEPIINEIVHFILFLLNFVAVYSRALGKVVLNLKEVHEFNG